MDKLVSVVIPCYNHSKYLPDALNSILNQTHKNWECLIINDGSIDKTEFVSKKWCLKDKRIKYYYKENGGLCSARNYGFKESKGVYVVTLDADDTFENSFIEEALRAMIKNKGIGIVSCWGYRFIENRKFDLFKPRGKTVNDYLFQNASLASAMYLKKCWLQVGGYDENMKNGYEDWEFNLNICKNGWNTYIIQKPLFNYRRHKVSMLNQAIKNYDKIVEEINKILELHTKKIQLSKTMVENYY